MKWFGPAPFSPASVETPEVPIPVGAPCAWCEEPITPSDAGYVIPLVDVDATRDQPYHADCWLRLLLGSVGHQQGTCACVGGDDGDPPELTRREAAHAAVATYQERHAGPRP